ncbi:MAG: hypothetical protein LBE35_09055 [Clostridiales bacterium]|jgi:hypothetical protein|nr:hypothetical protein [Clostridiales bacterium]
MAEFLAIRERQANRLFPLLLVKYSNPDIEIKYLDMMIALAKAAMPKQLISDVEMNVREYLGIK